MAYIALYFLNPVTNKLKNCWHNYWVNSDITLGFPWRIY